MKVAENNHRFYHHHALERLLPRYEELYEQGYTILTTQRDYDLTAYAWQRRYHGSDWIPLFHEQDRVWRTWVVPRAALVFNIEPGYRDWSLKRLREFFNYDFQTDWTPIGHVD